MSGSGLRLRLELAIIVTQSVWTGSSIVGSLFSSLNDVMNIISKAFVKELRHLMMYQWLSVILGDR